MKPITALVFILASLLSLHSRHALEVTKDDLNIDLPPIYLPEAKYIKLVTLGFDALVSDLIWFSTISYFGKQFREHGDYKWLSRRCEVVLELQPTAKERYEFCATLLSWVAKDIEGSNKILTRAIKAYPNYWRYYYLRGFNYWYFQKDEKAGANELTYAATLPDAPSLLPTLAAKLLSSDPGAAVQFLSESLKRATDPAAKQALEERLKQARLSYDLKTLSGVVKQYQQKTGQLPMGLEQLVQEGYLKFVPLEPFNGKYQIDQSTGLVTTSSNQKGLELNLNTPLGNTN